MTVQQWKLVWQALLVVIPTIYFAVRDGRIRASSQQEVLDALLEKVSDRVERARRAKSDDSLPDPYNPDK